MKKLLTLALAASMTLALSVNSFALGNYILSEEIGTEDETPAEEVTEEEPETLPEETVETPVPEETEKENPYTGADDFVGAAAAAAVLAGVGFAALKRK